MEKSEELFNLDEDKNQLNIPLPNEIHKAIFEYLNTYKDLATINTLNKKWSKDGKKLLIQHTLTELLNLVVDEEIAIDDVETKIDFLLINGYIFEAYQNLQDILSKLYKNILKIKCGSKQYVAHDINEKLAIEKNYENFKNLLVKKFKLAGYINCEFIAVISGLKVDKVCSSEQKYSILFHACVMKYLFKSRFQQPLVQVEFQLIQNYFASAEFDYLKKYNQLNALKNIIGNIQFIQKGNKIYLGEYLLEDLIAKACERENVKLRNIMGQAQIWIMRNDYLDEETASINRLLIRKDYASTMSLDSLKKSIQHLINNNYTFLAYKHLQNLFTMASNKLFNSASNLNVDDGDVERYKTIKNLLIEKFKIAGRINCEFITGLCSDTNYSYEIKYDALVTGFIINLLYENFNQDEFLAEQFWLINTYFKEFADLSYITIENGFNITADAVKAINPSLSFLTNKVFINEYLLEDLLDQVCKDFPKEEIIQSAKQWLMDNGYVIADHGEEIQPPNLNM